MKNTMLMFAYGMNTNQQEMSARCPSAVSLGHARLIDYQFRFATHADVIKCNNSYVDGVLWEISSDNLQALDVLEGYPYYYTRKPRRVAYQNRVVMAETYYMLPGNLQALPTSSYFNLVEQGYQQHGIATDQIYNAQADLTY
jgi:gamma-glutamylcyclotransferase (GGCT)/AIG2-like uncharacterized protein YtfP